LDGGMLGAEAEAGDDAPLWLQPLIMSAKNVTTVPINFNFTQILSASPSI
jgi:hypothetical protein